MPATATAAVVASERRKRVMSPPDRGVSRVPSVTLRHFAVVGVNGGIEVRRFGRGEARQHLDGLAAVLADCVAGGASVSYMAPFSHDDARAAFEGFVADADRGG